MARMVRSQIITLKEQEFALAAFVLGANSRRILFKHLIVNSLGTIIVTVTLMIPQAIFMEAFLSFVGVGISAPMASLGTLALTSYFESFILGSTTADIISTRRLHTIIIAPIKIVIPIIIV